jgi:hypothetical protein
VQLQDVSIGRRRFEECSEVKSGLRVVVIDDDDDDVLFSSFAEECLALVTMTRFA